MSFLSLSSDDLRTLEAALEFIDSYQDDDARLSSSLLADTPTLAAVEGEISSATGHVSSSDDASTREISSVGMNGQEPATSRKLSASALQQRRRKQEIQSLREQAGELEAHLSQLKRKHARRLAPSVESEQFQSTRTSLIGPQRPGPAVKKQKTSSVWMYLATIQYRERQRAELTNRKLKAIWSNQSKLNDALQQILQQRSTFAGRDLVFNQPTLYETPSSSYVGVNVMSELEQQMRSLYLESETVFRPTNNSIVSIATSTETQYEPGVGTFIDMRMTTPIACSLELAIRLVWEDVNSKRKYPDKIYEIKPGSDANSAEKNFLLTLRDGDRKIRLNGLQYVRKFDEPNRVVIVRSTLLLLPTSSAKFRDRTWMVITPSPEDPVHKSVIRYCCRVYTEPEATADLNHNDLEYLRHFVSSTLMNAKRTFAQMIQNAILEFSSRQSLFQRTSSSMRVP